VIFVFGSNLAGIHGAGAAAHARDCWGAHWDQGFGPQGQSFAIPTKGWRIDRIPLSMIATFVTAFLEYARDKSGLQFFVTRIGCGLAGFTDEEIAPLFKGAPPNCILPYGWRTVNGEEEGEE
jgi:hypothetical protein